VQLVDAREQFVKMRKSLGEKRKEISAEQVEEITGLYADFEEGEKVKIFSNEAFGFLRITVERPLRLRWEVTEKTSAVALAAKQVQKLEPDVREAVAKLLGKHAGASYETEKEMTEALGNALADLGLKRPAQKAVWSGLVVRDEEAPVITNRKGEPEPDPELRDNENVLLPPTPVQFEEDPTERLDSAEYRTAIDDYMRDEVLPYMPDARVNYEKTRIGYEIPLTRHFYKYVPPRPLEEIDKEIKELEEEIQRLLGGVVD
jgi:type I restriction enzyme M protein